MAKTKVKVGDVVELKSGGPRMTVTFLHNTKDGTHATCCWFSDGTLGYLNGVGLDSLNVCPLNGRDVPSPTADERDRIWKKFSERRGPMMHDRTALEGAIASVLGGEVRT